MPRTSSFPLSANNMLNHFHDGRGGFVPRLLLLSPHMLGFVGLEPETELPRAQDKPGCIYDNPQIFEQRPLPPYIHTPYACLHQVFTRSIPIREAIPNERQRKASIYTMDSGLWHSKCFLGPPSPPYQTTRVNVTNPYQRSMHFALLMIRL